MLTIEDYIVQRKKEDKLDEFVFKNHAHNLAACIRYVTDYYNDYLNYEIYNDELFKLEQTLLKIEKELGNDFPLSKDFVLSFYKDQKVRIDRIVKNQIKNAEYRNLLSTYEDFHTETENIVLSKQYTNLNLNQYHKELTNLARELALKELEKPNIEDLNRLDSKLAKWVKETYRNYNVNLFIFARDVALSYHEKYIEYFSDHSGGRGYFVNKYNYRYIDNPFDIDEIYEENSSKPFISGKKGELEMIIMNVWLNEWVEDYGYWPEYVNLCVSAGRVNLADSINELYPVLYKNVVYPPDICDVLNYIESQDGCVKTETSGNYILALTFKEDKDVFWKDWEVFEKTCKNLQITFKRMGNPYAIELMSPIREVSYSEDNFIDFYKVFESKFGKLKGTTITLVNGPRKTGSSAKKISMFQSPEEIVKLCEIIVGLKFKLKLTLSLKNLIGNKDKYRNEENLVPLLENKYLFEGLHISKPFGVNEINSKSDSKNYHHLSSFGFTRIPGVLDVLLALLSDHKCHYLVPHGINDEVALEDLCDDLLRGGFSFYQKES